MKAITNISNKPKQQFSFQTSDGKILTIWLYYISNQIGWFFDLEYDGIKSNCHRVTNSPNIIREKQNIYPFGVGCSVSDGEEPWLLDDFASGRATLYLMTKEDVKIIERSLYGKVF